ncbi:hypothetical protein EXU30_09175 [Shewanella maritima]|uniref:Uncharacterized protein n=1 Tax=Shewanella maritima TaxID=2520507 RepID=A0A411PH27_9GAMM|nr:hypothetical protein [Shewanella maritima]QBF82845.1 hypothetical protein EXU30_09175 [Shewanella maritima]
MSATTVYSTSVNTTHVSTACKFTRIKAKLATRLLALCLTLMPVTAIHADDLSQLIQASKASTDPSASLDTKATKEKLALGSVTNAQGEPIAIPEQTQSSLEFDADDYLTNPRVRNLNQPQSSASRTKAKDKAKSSTSYVANNPSCRWLANRLKYLGDKLHRRNDSHGDHYRNEFTVRKQEFNCLKCSDTGPEQSDHARCQYRR